MSKIGGRVRWVDWHWRRVRARRRRHTPTGVWLALGVLLGLLLFRRWWL